MILDNSSYAERGVKKGYGPGNLYINNVALERQVEPELADGATYAFTVLEDKDGEWNNNGLDRKDGYVVLHKGAYHDVYKLKGRMRG